MTEGGQKNKGSPFCNPHEMISHFGHIAPLHKMKSNYECVAL